MGSEMCIRDSIQDGPYRMVKRDPGERFRKLLKPLLSDGVLDIGALFYTGAPLILFLRTSMGCLKFTRTIAPFDPLLV